MNAKLPRVPGSFLLALLPVLLPMLLIDGCGSVSGLKPGEDASGSTDLGSRSDTGADLSSPQDAIGEAIIISPDAGNLPPPSDGGQDAIVISTDAGPVPDAAPTPDAIVATDAITLPDAATPDGGVTCPAPPAGIVSWWHGDGDFTDAVGSSPGVNAGGVTFAAGAVGQAFSLSGAAGSYIQVADAAPLRITGPMTIDAWINPTMTTTGRIVDKVTAGGTNGYLLDVLNGQARFFVVNDSVMSPVPTGAFTHVTGVYSGTTLSLYINGVLAATKTTAVAAIPSNDIPLHIGADSANSTLFTGIIDEPRIFGRALSAAEVQSIYQVGSPAHCGCIAVPSGLVSWWPGENSFSDVVGSNPGSNSGGVTFATGAVGQCFNLSGAVSSYVLVPNSTSLQITGALTLEAWIDPTALAGRLIDKITAGQANGYMMDIFTNQIRLDIGGDALMSGTTVPLVAGKLTHVVGVYDGATLGIYLNGAKVATKTTLITTIPVNTLPLRIGVASDGTTLFTGIIDEPRIYSRALSSDEVLAIYRDGSADRCP